MIEMNPQRQVIHRVPGVEAHDQEFDQYPIKVMVWACIAFGERSPIERVEGHMNAEK
jgi:hypothetical protein